MGFHLIILALVVIFPSWLNLDPWRPVIDDTPPAPLAFSHTDKRTSLADWVDSASASWQFKDVRVTVLSATVAPIELTGPNGMKRLSKEQYLQLSLRVANIGVERGFDLSGWATNKNPEQVQLTDSNGRPLKPAPFEEGWFPSPTEATSNKRSDKVFPNHSSETRLIFSSPQPRIDYLRLALPGTMFGFKEEIKFQINSGSLIVVAPQKK